MKTNFKATLAGCAVAAGLLLASSASAATLTWTFSDADLGGDLANTVTGSFDYNTTSSTYSHINITTTVGAVTTIFNQQDNPGNVTRNFGFGALTAGGSGTGEPIIDVNAINGEDFTSPGIDTIGPNTSTANSFVSANGTCLINGIVPCGGFSPNLTLTGTLTGVVDPVPEPASWALMAIGLGALGAGLRSRRTVAAAA